jgi:hypothetical protein
MGAGLESSSKLAMSTDTEEIRTFMGLPPFCES